MGEEIKSFLEKQPLYTKHSGLPEFQHAIKPITLSLFCSICKGERPFRQPNTMFADRRIQGSGYGKGPPSPPPSLRSGIYDLEYVCTDCAKTTYKYWVEVDKDEDWIRKVGQLPPLQIGTPRSLQNLLEEHQTYYKKGLICESQSFGIGAYAYYRRIVEEIIDDLLASIAEIIDPSEQERYSAALEEAKKTTIAKDKIALVKDLLPPVLRPANINPLAVLHSSLSAGLHGRSDDECLESGQHIRGALVFLVDQLERHKESSQKFTDAMRKLLDSDK